MFIAIRKRLDRKEEGFTLIELMVVVLIIAILIAIAIPTFLGARERAQDRAAQSNVRNAFTAEKVWFTDNQTYTGTAADIMGIEPSLSVVTTNPPAVSTGNSVSIVLDASTTPDTLYVAALSASGSCFFLRDDGASATNYAKDTDGTCGAASTQTYTTTPW